MSLCPVCKKEASFANVRSFGDFTLQECATCKVQFWWPLKSRGAGWYEQDQRYAAQARVKPGIERMYHKKFLALYGDRVQGKKILDVGCGSGEFLAELAKRGALVWGIDFDRSAIEAARLHFGLDNLSAVSLEQFIGQNPSARFHFIVAFEVLQYTDEPLRFLNEMNNLLEGGGSIVASVPSRERLLANWHTWDLPPNHLTRWNEDSLKNVASLAGLKVVAVYHIEQFKMLREAITGRFRLGVVQKAQHVSTGKTTGGLITRCIIFGAKAKEYVLGFVPACFLWVFAKAQGKDQGTLVVVLRKMDSMRNL